MQKLRFFVDMPHGNSFVGGIASMINRYIDHAETFARQGAELDLIDLSKYNVWYPRLRKISNILNMFRQCKGVMHCVKEEPWADLHIHSSLKWTLAKDLFIIANIRKRQKGKICLTIHHAVPENFFYGRIGEKIGVHIICNYVDKLIVLSKGTEQYFLKNGVESKKIRTLYTFHDMPPHEEAIDYNAKNGLVFMGTISRWKGIFDLVEAVRNSKNISLITHICGTFPDRHTEEAFHKAISGMEDRFILHGYITGELKKTILADAAIMVLPSRAEGMPISIMEAMACGCAIISTNVGAIPEVISEENGILVESGDIHNLTEAIDNLLENPDILLHMQKTNLSDSVAYTIDRHIKDLMTFIAN